MSSKPEERLNILLITADQWRGDCLPGAVEGLKPLTPALDAFATDSTRFARHYCQAYPCGPARAGLVTGLYPHKHRSIRNGTPLDVRHRTLFQEARRAGYRPWLFGYTDTTADPRHLDVRDPARGDYEGVAAGLDVGLLLTESARPWLAHLKRKGYAVPDPDGGRAGIFRQCRFGEPAVFSAEDSEAAFLTDRFLDHLSVTGDAPFFAHLSYIAPHPPFAAAEPYFSAADPGAQELPIPSRDAAKQHTLLRHILANQDLSGFVPGLSGPVASAPEPVIRQVRAIYAALCAEVDFQFGRIVAALQKSGLYDRTLIILSGDHGEQLFDHGLLGKLAYFDQSAHIPLMIRDPRPATKAGRGRLVRAFTQSIDILPTVLQATGLSIPPNADGESLLPWLSGESPSGWRDAAHWSTDFADLKTCSTQKAFGLLPDRCSLHVVRTERFKYVRFAGMEPVLFDLRDDPFELVNRAGDPGLAALEREGTDRLLDLRIRHEDRTLSGVQAVDGGLYGTF
ncbi:hypothetical protein ASC97_31370 [Rhizobium sp. Root1203]|uniref:sulfatase-like hydrolase/transferase n=1 Tax=Rhizobium sp. Root1203 TaxID=1736427 RepID=UPI000708B6C8|nr:sulfatase-like hydrolase/transferase [Rhizobium sp. Root1203]KQV15302.1 hypothetical protein ASC97_31370 [Rhizobium sp. Root1203]